MIANTAQMARIVQLKTMVGTANGNRVMTVNVIVDSHI